MPHLQCIADALWQLHEEGMRSLRQVNSCPTSGYRYGTNRQTTTGLKHRESLLPLVVVEHAVEPNDGREGGHMQGNRAIAAAIAATAVVAATAPVPATPAVVATPAVSAAVSPAAVPIGLVSAGCPKR